MLDRTQSRIRRIIQANYRNCPDGLSGNDDCGQMSAWYLFSALGFYPLTPASGEYAIGIPRFEEIVLDLDNGRHLVIRAESPDRNEHLTSVSFNGRKLNRPFIKVKDVMNGGILEFRP